MKETDIDKRLAECRGRLTSLETQAEKERKALFELIEEEEQIKGTMLCPRRSRCSRKTETPDHWREDGRCSFCGSISPDELFKRIDAGETIDPTDKNYKIYVGRSKFYFPHFNREEMQQFVDLSNAKKLKLGYPGHFYQMPFFMVKQTNSSM